MLIVFIYICAGNRPNIINLMVWGNNNNSHWGGQGQNQAVEPKE